MKYKQACHVVCDMRMQMQGVACCVIDTRVVE